MPRDPEQFKVKLDLEAQMKRMQMKKIDEETKKREEKAKMRKLLLNQLMRNDPNFESLEIENNLNTNEISSISKVNENDFEDKQEFNDYDKQKLNDDKQELSDDDKQELNEFQANTITKDIKESIEKTIEDLNLRINDINEPDDDEVRFEETIGTSNKNNPIPKPEPIIPEELLHNEPEVKNELVDINDELGDSVSYSVSLADSAKLGNIKLDEMNTMDLNFDQTKELDDEDKKVLEDLYRSKDASMGLSVDNKEVNVPQNKVRKERAKWADNRYKIPQFTEDNNPEEIEEDYDNASFDEDEDQNNKEEIPKMEDNKNDNNQMIVVDFRESIDQEEKKKRFESFKERRMKQEEERKAKAEVYYI